MQDGPWEVVVYGVAVHQVTGEVRPVQMGWSAAEIAAWFLESGGRVLRAEGLPPEDLARYTRLIFAADGGNGQPVAVADPVNIDGGRRNSLRDRVARRHLGEPEAMAAD